MVSRRALGCLYGQLVGDALGARYEFMNSFDATNAIRNDSDNENFLPILGGGPFHVARGQVTDDSEMAFAMLSSILRIGKFDAADIACSFVKWAQSSPPDIGITTKNALQIGLLLKKMNPRTAAPQLIDLQNAIPSSGQRARREYDRSLDIHYYDLWHATPKLLNWQIQDHGGILVISFGVKTLVQEVCLLTHCDNACINGTYSYVIAIRELLDNGDNMDAYKAAIEVNENPIVQDILKSAATAPSPVKLHSGEYISGCDKCMGYFGVALQNAFYQLTHATSFYDGLINTISHGGDTDTNGAIAGALLGARFGIESIPESWKCAVRGARSRNGLPREISLDAEFMCYKLLKSTDI